MVFGVVIFPGSNCDHDVIYVLETILQQKVEILWHKDTKLKMVDAIILPGGFSYGDYLRAGAIARFSPIMQEVINFAQKDGFVMGICNGFQILCEAGLLPGTLLHNINHRFICKNVYIKAENKNTILTRHIPENMVLKIPIAHAQGNYYVDNNTLEKMKINGQIIFKYCNKDGITSSDANPNGSIENIAGVCNEKKNVFGLMPHPERAADKMLFNTDGLYLFESIIKELS
ncbi:MAG: phosphoribosylformylglycinamidine synthase subunit PurQ [Bacteroidales bacterium]|nr:phosphoribosylformylglycinamidine synthase subunit PurQ [Bacteroidales bacterium]